MAETDRARLGRPGTVPTRTAPFSKRDAALMVGCVPFWLCPRAASLMLLNYQDGPAALEPGAMLTWYALFALAVVAASALAVRFPRAVMGHTALGRTALGRTCVVVSALGGSAAIAGMLSGTLEGATLGGALVLMAIFAVVHLNGIAQLCMREPLTKVALYVVGSSALANGVRALAGSLDISPVQAALPLLSAAFLLALKPAGESEPVTAGAVKSLRLISWPIVLACAVLIALWSFTLGTLSQNQNWTLQTDQKTLSYVLTCVLLVGMTAAFALDLRRGGGAEVSSPSILYLFVAIALLYMAVLLGMCVVPEADFVTFKRVLIAIEQCLEILLLALTLTDIAHRRLCAPPALALCIVALTNSPWLIASNVLTAAQVPASPVLENLPVVLSFATAIVLVALLLASIRRIQARPASADDRGAQRLLCEQVADAFGLSKKELEVLNLLYRGNSARKIAETLCVTDSTVRSHTNSIYRKLGVHSRQEAIDLVDRHRGGLR